MQGIGKMQYRNAGNFNFWSIKLFLGGLHKVVRKRQMFLSQNHTLRFVFILHKIKHIKLHYYGVLSPLDF